MIKKIIGVIFFVGIIIGGVWVNHTYQSYTARKQARIARLQQQAEDIKITTIEGWTNAEMATYIGQQKLVPEKDFNTALTNFDLTPFPLIKQSKPAKSSLEGYLFPDTYRFTKDAIPNFIISKMLTNFTARLEALGVRAGQGDYAVPGYDTTKMSFYQLLTLASIVERESGDKGDGKSVSPDQERAVIAGVFYNRLAKGQALESDATVNYVTGKNTPAVNSTDLNLNSPYNTYKYPGLPPGPICNPSLASLKAVLYPTKTDYYYFLHRQPSGEVVFAKTFEEHKRNKAQ